MRSSEDGLFDPANLAAYPTQPGVYLMKDKEGTILYVGKAKNLRQRLKQYFSISRDARAMVPYLVSKVFSIETIVVLSEKEALLLENTLIKQHKPRYNALLKDDKTYAALRINAKEKWPKLEIVRLRSKPKDQAQYFGPYTGGTSARKLFDLLNTLFPLRQCSDPEFARRTRPCILYDIKRCLAPCVGRCTPDEYQNYVERNIAFLQGRDTEIIAEIKKEMLNAATELKFEEAALLKKKLEQIEKAWQGQHVETYHLRDLDAFGLCRKADKVVVCQLFFREGKLLGSTFFPFENSVEEENELYSSLLLQLYSEKNAPPKEILLDREIEELEPLSELLSELSKRKVVVAAPQRGEKRSIALMAKANATAEFDKVKEEEEVKQALLLELQERLQLKQFPKRIECIDTSHLSGSNPVAAIVGFTNGIKDTKRYRCYNVKAAPGDDYGAMRETLLRRLRRGEADNDLPDLLLIDGGKGHLHIAEEVLSELNIITVSLVAIAKDAGQHTKNLTSEQLFLCEKPEPIVLGKHAPLLHFLQTIRDEAHRFVINFQKNKRSKKTISTAIDTIAGIGPAKRKKLLLHFGSLAKLKVATEEELLKVSGLSKKDVTTILLHFQSKK